MFSRIRSFRCVNCNEMVNDSMPKCPFCSVAIDEGVAALLSERQEKTNQAYSDASYLRTAAVAMFVFFAFGLIFTLAYFAFAGTFAVVGVLLLRWQMKFGDLLTNDPDYERARRSKNVGFVLWIVACPLGLVFNPFLDTVLTELGL